MGNIYILRWMVSGLKGIKEITLMVCNTTWECSRGVQIRCLISDDSVVSRRFIRTESLLHKGGVNDVLAPFSPVRFMKGKVTARSKGLVRRTFHVNRVCNYYFMEGVPSVRSALHQYVSLQKPISVSLTKGKQGKLDRK